MRGLLKLIYGTGIFYLITLGFAQTLEDIFQIRGATHFIKQIYVYALYIVIHNPLYLAFAIAGALAVYWVRTLSRW